MFYAVDGISGLLLGKSKKPLYEKGKIFYKYDSELEDRNVLQKGRS